MGFKLGNIVLTQAFVQGLATSLYSLGLYVLQSGDNHQPVILKTVAELQQISALHDYYLKSLLNASGISIPTPSNCVSLPTLDVHVHANADYDAQF
jgi:hypothetical protein